VSRWHRSLNHTERLLGLPPDAHGVEEGFRTLGGPLQEPPCPAGIALGGGPYPQQPYVAAAAGQKPRGDIAVAAVVARAAQHGHRAARGEDAQRHRDQDGRGQGNGHECEVLCGEPQERSRHAFIEGLQDQISPSAWPKLILVPTANVTLRPGETFDLIFWNVPFAYVEPGVVPTPPCPCTPPPPG